MAPRHRPGAASLQFVAAAMGAMLAGGVPATDADLFLQQKAPAWPLPNGLNALEGIAYPAEWPWSEADMRREDEADDALFYREPRLVRHIDDNAISGLTRWYEAHLPTGGEAAILDVCSSWISHFPEGLAAKRVAGIGMNEPELRANKQLTESVAQNLNKNPAFPYADGSFDAIVNAVSVDYLKKPREIFQEFRRVARPGALLAMSFSNRMFWTKAVRRWTQASEFQRLLMCASYFRFAGFRDVRAERIDAGRGDPMYVVYAHAPPSSASTGGEL